VGEPDTDVRSLKVRPIRADENDMARSSAPIHSCPSCLAPLVEIRLGAELTLRSCSRCDSRFWSRNDEAIDLDGVLGAVAETGRRPLRVVR
jgi:hypothetical protein